MEAYIKLSKKKGAQKGKKIQENGAVHKIK